MKKILPLVIFGFLWVVSLGWFGYQKAGCQKPVVTLQGDTTAYKETWHGIYFSGQKAGYSVTVSQSLDGGGRQVSNRAFLRINMMDTPQQIKTVTSYQLDRNFYLQDFDFVMEGAAEINVHGRVNGQQLDIDVTTGGQKQRQTIKLDGPVYLPDAIEPMIANKSIKKGSKYNFSTFDPTSLSLQPAVIEVMEQESLKIADRSHWATKLSLEMAGTTSTIWVDSAGNTLKENGPLGITLIWEPKETALRIPPDDNGIDLLTQLSVPATGSSLDKPRDIEHLKIKISGLNISQMDIAGGRQQITDADQQIVIITQERMDGLNDILPDSLKKYLEPTALIQSEDSRIKDTARKIVAGKKSSWETVLAISQWVNKNLDKQMTVSLPSAVEVLLSRRGDCNEHATLFAALARASGIPAKLCLGVVFMDGRFYYHAWNAVYCGRWIELDPTFGLNPADAARLRIIEGDLSQQNRLLPALGNLKIEILESR
ncbi:MAG: transglutaminase-like domain-containing protein [Candidatus Edwardsbacteria bacterium]|nr:transglutaminase-like domain-containing protein [Candidatus Edwardsbacteria bacterium]MBU1577626.1 transglutaminase-like domain-containing protein [Candidatus Edwardsbacteria bacterium]MBU2462965.1 transglutaminase-like domain-containing protein [Candidatus Edwardsbacteria bacterium]MBU2595094.1 transglutaminase-like domain-containing protein [Candidatus Edwardsbacteria bacterium]